MANFTCQKCGANRVRRSRTKDYAERILKALGRKAYRCEECNWRGFVVTRRDTASYYEENYWAYRWIKHISVALPALVAILAIVYLVCSALR